MFSASSDSGSTRISAWMVSAFPSRRIGALDERVACDLRGDAADVGGERGGVAGDRADEIQTAPASPCPGPVICDDRMSFPATIDDDLGICSSVRLSVASEIAGSVSTIKKARRRAEPEEWATHDPLDPGGPELASPVPLLP